MKVKRMRNGYLLRLNDSEFEALRALVDAGYPPTKVVATNDAKRGLRSFENGLQVTEDRRRVPAQT